MIEQHLELDSSAAGSGLSKSQKKRMKRNNAKAKKADEQVAAAKRSQDVGPLNPLDEVKAGLLKRGRALNEIEKALEEMWNSQLEYDDIESVDRYLTLKAAAGRISSTSENTVETPMIHTAPSVETSSSSETVATESVNPVGVDPGVSIAPSESAENVSDVDESDAFVEDKEESLNNHNHSLPADSRSSKFDIVSNNENLNHVMTALSGWVTESATLAQIKDFCNHSKSSAFITVVRRCLEESGEDSKGLIVDLVTSILRSSGMPISGALPVAKSLWNLLNKAQSPPYAPLTDGILNTLPFEVASHLSTTLDMMNSTREETEKTIQRLEMDVSDMVSVLHRSMSTSGAGELMSKRDRSKGVVNTSSSIVHLTNAYILGSSTSGSANRHGSVVNEDQSSLLASLLGDKYQMAQSCRGKVEDLKRKYAESNSSVISSKNSTLSDLQNQKIRQKGVQDRIQALREELRSLADEDAVLSQSIAKTEMNLKLIDQSLSSEARKMEKDIESMSHLLALEDLATEFSNCALDLRTVFRNVAIQSAAAKVEKDRPKLEDDFQAATHRFESFISHVKAYFEAERNMIDFLKKRYLSIEMNIPLMEKQIEECSMLGMKTNVAEMTKEMKQSIANVVEDKNATLALKSEAESMKHEYIKQVEEFVLVCKMVGVNPSALSSFHPLITGIKSVCALIELQFDDRSLALFDHFAPEESAPIAVVASEIEVAPITTNGHGNTNGISVGNGTSNGAHAQKPEPPRSVSAVETAPKSTAAPPMKRGWGSNTAQPTKQPALSLTDIQKEQKQSV